MSLSQTVSGIHMLGAGTVHTPLVISILPKSRDDNIYIIIYSKNHC